jgi:hypothetical protein
MIVKVKETNKFAVSVALVHINLCTTTPLYQFQRLLFSQRGKKKMERCIIYTSLYYVLLTFKNQEAEFTT